MMYMNVGAQNEEGERELFLHPASTTILSAERSMEFVCAPYQRDSLSDLVLRLICNRVCGTCLFSPLLC